MASEDRPPADSLIELLHDAPYTFDFFQAVRRLECAYAAGPRIGASQGPADDPVRFGQEPSLSFAPATLASFGSDGGRRPRLLVNFFGLLGPNGPMPLHFTEYVRGRSRLSKDPTLARFLDVFHHRMISLFYRAWATHQITVSRDRPDEDRFAVYIGSLIGIGMAHLRRRDSVQDEAKLYYSGRLSCPTRNAEGLQAVLADYFGVPTRIDEFFGHWVELPPQYLLKLGERPETGSLGQTAIVGARFWDRQQRFLIAMGPLTFHDYQRFLPTGRSFRRVADWVRNYIGQQLAADLQLILKAAEVPPLKLGSVGQLGWTTWLTSRPVSRDADDLTLRTIAA